MTFFVEFDKKSKHYIKIPKSIFKEKYFNTKLYLDFPDPSKHSQSECLYTKKTDQY
jgi:hypothetical protein